MKNEGKVDVLAVMDRLREMIGNEWPEREQADKARNAVGELIDAAMYISSKSTVSEWTRFHATILAVRGVA